jgi:hypothetical protein
VEVVNAVERQLKTALFRCSNPDCVVAISWGNIRIVFSGGACASFLPGDALISYAVTGAEGSAFSITVDGVKLDKPISGTVGVDGLGVRMLSV